MVTSLLYNFHTAVDFPSTESYMSVHASCSTSSALCLCARSSQKGVLNSTPVGALYVSFQQFCCYVVNSWSLTILVSSLRLPFSSLSFCLYFFVNSFCILSVFIVSCSDSISSLSISSQVARLIQGLPTYSCLCKTSIYSLTPHLHPFVLPNVPLYLLLYSPLASSKLP